IRGGTSRTRPGSRPGTGGHSRRSVATGEPHRANRVRECHRSGRPRLCRKPGTTTGQRDWIYLFRIRDGRKMAGGAQGNGAASDLRSSTSRSSHHCRNGILGCDPCSGAVDWVQVTPIDVRQTSDIERAVAAFARTPNSGLIVTADPAAIVHREAIIALAARHRLPAVYPYRFFVISGGLIFYGLDNIEQYRLAAGYVDRILKGEKPADLPVQAPTKYELVINLKTAKALGLDIPATVLARSDEVIE